MKRYARTVMLRDDPEVIAQYEAYHANPYPEVVASLSRDGVQRVYIYRYGRTLFMYMETNDDFDPEHAAPPGSLSPREIEWDQIMRSFQETVPGAPEGSKWVEMKEVFGYH